MVSWYIYRIRDESNYICDCAKGNTVARIIGKRDNESDYPCVNNLRIILAKLRQRRMDNWNEMSVRSLT